MSSVYLCTQGQFPTRRTHATQKAPCPQIGTPVRTHIPPKTRADVGVRSWAWGRGGREGVHPGQGGQLWLSDGFPLPRTVTGLCRTAFQTCPRAHT